jgi:hypothetical protein
MPDARSSSASRRASAPKAALHRGRERLREPEDGPAARRPAPSVALVDRFVELFNAADREGLVALVLENASVMNYGGHEEQGLRTRHGWVEGALGGHPEWPELFHHDSQRAARSEFEGEPIVLIFRTRAKWGGEALEAAVRLEEQEGRVARLRSYGFCPETMRALGEALGLPVRTGLYHAPAAAPGSA